MTRSVTMQLAMTTTLLMTVFIFQALFLEVNCAGLNDNGGVEISLIGKQTSQSSDFGPAYTSDKAVDGETSGVFNDRTCMHSKKDKSPFAWWEVDIGESRCVGRVEIYNRVDCCETRLKGAIVRFGPNSDRNNTACGTISLDKINADQKIDVTCDRRGQYLSIELPRKQYLQLCEVRAFVGQCPEDEDDEEDSQASGTSNRNGAVSGILANIGHGGDFEFDISN